MVKIKRRRREKGKERMLERCKQRWKVQRTERTGTGENRRKLRSEEEQDTERGEEGNNQNQKVENTTEGEKRRDGGERRRI